MIKRASFYILFLTLATLCCIPAWGSEKKKYYYDPQIRSTGNGLVYISRQAAPTMSSYYYSGHYGTVANPTSAFSSSLSDYKLWAYPAHGYKFDSWTVDTAVVTLPPNPTGQGDVTTIFSFSNEQANPTKTYIKANFTPDEDELQVVLLRPDKGSISLKSVYYYIRDGKFQQASDTITLSATDSAQIASLSHYSADKLVLTASDARAFSGWYKIENDSSKTLLHTESVYEIGTAFSSSVTICAEFNEANFKVGSQTYTDIDSALLAAGNDTSKTVILLKDYTLTHPVSIPPEVTFFIPNNADYELYTTAPKSSHNFLGEIAGTADYDRSFVFRKLTLAEGIHLTVYGALNVGGFRWCASYMGFNGEKIPETTGNYRLDQGYGLIDMAANSSIILNDSASLCCWGRIRGEGTITAHNGTTIRECWVNTDYRESDAYRIIAENLDCFPMNQYYIQDIQVPATFYAGSQLILIAGMYLYKTDRPYTGEISWIGSNNAFFQLSGDACITKRYDVATDRLMYDLYNGVTINFAELNLNYKGTPYSFSTKNKIFDITNNCSIHVHSGKTLIHHDLALAAGAEMNIDKDAQVEVAEHVSLFVFDSDDWDNFACMKKIVPLFLPQYELSATGANYYATHGIEPQSIYSGYATYKMLRTEDNLSDAKLTVNGTLTIKGGNNNLYYQQLSGLYTTTAGAQIMSDSVGTIIFEQGIGTQTQVAQLWGAGRGSNDSAQQQIMVDVVPAILQNAEGAPLQTAEYTEGVTFEYTDGQWMAKEFIPEVNPLDEVPVNAVEAGKRSGKVMKIGKMMKNGQLYILRDGNLFTPLGFQR